MSDSVWNPLSDYRIWMWLPLTVQQAIQHITQPHLPLCRHTETLSSAKSTTKLSTFTVSEVTWSDGYHHSLSLIVEARQVWVQLWKGLDLIGCPPGMHRWNMQGLPSDAEQNGLFHHKNTGTVSSTVCGCLLLKTWSHFDNPAYLTFMSIWVGSLMLKVKNKSWRSAVLKVLNIFVKSFILTWTWFV